MKLNIIKLKISFFLILMTFSYLSFSQSNNKLIVGANRTELFLNHIEGLNVAVVAKLSSKIKSNTIFGCSSSGSVLEGQMLGKC